MLGETFTAEGAAALDYMSVDAARGLLDGLVAKAFLEAGADADASAGQHAFLQGVVRRVALARTSRGELNRRHLAAVDHLLGLSEIEPEQSAVLAGQWLAAVEAEPRAVDAGAIRQRAVAMLRAAANRAAAVGTLNEALLLYDRGRRATGRCRGAGRERPGLRAVRERRARKGA